MDAGIRFTSKVYIRFMFELDSGDSYVILELIDDDGVKHEITGVIAWD